MHRSPPCKVCGCYSVCFLLLHVLQLLPPITFTQRNLCGISESTMTRQPKSDLPLSSYGYRKCMFVDFFTKYVGFSTCLHCRVWSGWWKMCTLFFNNVNLVHFLKWWGEENPILCMRRRDYQHPGVWIRASSALVHGGQGTTVSC